VPLPLLADALGDARLFFTPAERDPSATLGLAGQGVVVDGASGHAPSREDGSGGAPDEGDREARLPAERRGPFRSDDGTEPSSRGSHAAARRRIGFDAVLRVGDRVRIVLGGGPCRAGSEGAELQCDRLPDGIESLVLGPDGRRLVVTFDSGRRARFGVGETISSP